MKNACIAVIAGAAALAAAGWAHAAAVPVQPAAVQAHPTLPQVEPPAAAVRNQQATEQQNQPANNHAVAVLAAVRSGAKDAPPAAPENRDEPFYQHLASAGRYVLDVGSLSEPDPAATRKVAEVPLPGALWLFGTALVAFLGISARRKY